MTAPDGHCALYEKLQEQNMRSAKVPRVLFTPKARSCVMFMHFQEKPK